MQPNFGMQPLSFIGAERKIEGNRLFFRVLFD
jgi:hypothetical protein